MYLYEAQLEVGFRHVLSDLAGSEKLKWCLVR